MRFEIKDSEYLVNFIESDTQAYIMVDTITGVHYIIIQEEGGANRAITPLLGSDGKPVVLKPDEER